MISNYFTLRHVSNDLSARLRESRLTEAFTQHRDELVLMFEAPSPVSVIIRCTPGWNAIFAHDDIHRARRNSATIFPDFSGQSISAVHISPTDREIHFVFSSGERLVAQLFGSRANVLQCAPNGDVAGAFLRRQHSPRIESISPSIPPTVDLAKLLASGSDASESLRAALKRSLPSFGSLLMEEIAVRSGIELQKPLSSLASRDIESIVGVFVRLRDELLSPPSPRIYYEKMDPAAFSVVPLQQCASLRFEEFESIHAAIRAFIGSVRRHKDFDDRKTETGRLLEKELEGVRQKISHVTGEMVGEGDAAQAERFGKVLTAHIAALTKGMTEADVEDPFTPSERLTIPLDRNLTPARNAERYFDKARRLRVVRKEQLDRIGDLHRRELLLMELTGEWEEIRTQDGFDAFLSNRKEALERCGIVFSKEGGVAKRELPPFRIFTVDGGFQVWAGKSGENNDLLTTRHTAQDDLWFHARGVGGSHVVLKVRSAPGQVSKRAIQQAASIAAYYSKMKKATHVAVTMCEGKYVRKPKGVPAGTVHVERETTVFADPALPQEQ